MPSPTSTSIDLHCKTFVAQQEQHRATWRHGQETQHSQPSTLHTASVDRSTPDSDAFSRGSIFPQPNLPTIIFLLRLLTSACKRAMRRSSGRSRSVANAVGHTAGYPG
jgi:hypothetical protein